MNSYHYKTNEQMITHLIFNIFSVITRYREVVIISNKVIIKKQDAVPNIILFLFSSFLLPKGIKKISLRKIFQLMEPFNKTETAIRMGLSRAVKSGILKNAKEGDQVFYEIVDGGLNVIEQWKEVRNVFNKKISMRRSSWNNYWCLVAVDALNIKSNKDEFVSFLKDLGFSKINKETYIHPYDFSKDIELKIQNFGLEEEVKVFMSKLVSYHNNTKFVQDLWDIDELNKKYLEFSVSYPPTSSVWNNTAEPDKIIEFCHNLTNDFTEIIKYDPGLPSEFLGPNWEGDNVLRLVDQFNKTIVPKAKEIIDRVLQK